MLLKAIWEVYQADGGISSSCESIRHKSNFHQSF